MRWNIKEIIDDCREYDLTSGDALYTDGDSVWLGRDGGQPSGSYCVIVGWQGYTPAAVDWHDIADMLESCEAIAIRAAYSPRD